MVDKPFEARVLGCILAVTALLGGAACSSRPVRSDGGDGGPAGSDGNGTGGNGATGTGGTTGLAGTGATAGASGAAGSGGIAGGAGGRGGTGGGSAGRGGTGGDTGGRGGAGAASPECTTASDCKLVDGCCSCQAIPVGDAAPPCTAVCKQNQCAARQLPPGAVDCVAGKCVAGFACDATKITCKVATPACPAGEVPTVNASGNCYVGTCAPETECKTVSSCAVCNGTNEACVSYGTQLGAEYHCVTIPPECGGNGGCTCLGVASCRSPYGACVDYSGIRGVSCTCPSC